MGLEVFEEYNSYISEDTTVQELIDELGKESVIRGVKYMYSLSDADEEYRRSVSQTDFAGKHADSLADDDVELDENRKEEINKKWAEKSSDSGLGVNDE